jgi:hypothetical protein
MTDDDFIEAFESTAISPEDWSHEAHVRMGWIYCQRKQNRDDATNKARAGIRALNKANNTPGKLYHDTVTIAFMRIIWARAQAGPATWPEFLADNGDLIASNPSVLSKYYSRELLDTDEARLGFVEPDCEPLPA